MKLYPFLILLIFSSFYALGQTGRGDSIKNKSVAMDSLEKESEFPGGDAAWIEFLQKNLEYPQRAYESNVQGDVIVQFIVDKDGTVSDIKAISGPAELRGAAVKVIQKSPKWIPAFQYGKQVRSYKKQPVKFRLVIQKK